MLFVQFLTWLVVLCVCSKLLFSLEWNFLTDKSTFVVVFIVLLLRLAFPPKPSWEIHGASLNAIVAGLKDSLSLHTAVPIFLNSSTIRFRFFQTFVLNIIIFAGW